MIKSRFLLKMLTSTFGGLYITRKTLKYSGTFGLRVKQMILCVKQLVLRVKGNVNYYLLLLLYKTYRALYSQINVL